MTLSPGPYEEIHQGQLPFYGLGTAVPKLSATFISVIALYSPPIKVKLCDYYPY